MSETEYEQQDIKVYETVEITLVAYLLYVGFDVHNSYWVGRSYTWEFVESEELIQSITDFSLGHALVDPKSFSKIFSQIKFEMRKSKKDEAPFNPNTLH